MRPWRYLVGFAAAGPIPNRSSTATATPSIPSEISIRQNISHETSAPGRVSQSVPGGVQVCLPGAASTCNSTQAVPEVSTTLQAEATPTTSAPSPVCATSTQVATRRPPLGEATDRTVSRFNLTGLILEVMVDLGDSLQQMLVAWGYYQDGDYLKATMNFYNASSKIGKATNTLAKYVFEAARSHYIESLESRIDVDEKNGTCSAVVCAPDENAAPQTTTNGASLDKCPGSNIFPTI